jgi:hypothetical protein
LPSCGDVEDTAVAVTDVCNDDIGDLRAPEHDFWSQAKVVLLLDAVGAPVALDVGDGDSRPCWVCSDESFVRPTDSSDDHAEHVGRDTAVAAAFAVEASTVVDDTYTDCRAEVPSRTVDAVAVTVRQEQMSVSWNMASSTTAG